MRERGLVDDHDSPGRRPSRSSGRSWPARSRAYRSAGRVLPAPRQHASGDRRPGSAAAHGGRPGSLPFRHWSRHGEIRMYRSSTMGRLGRLDPDPGRPAPARPGRRLRPRAGRPAVRRRRHDRSPAGSCSSSASALIIAGVIWLRRSADKDRISTTGLAGTGQITGLTQTGMMVNNQPVVKIDMLVTVPGRQPYPASVREIVPLILLGSLGAGRPPGPRRPGPARQDRGPVGPGRRRDQRGPVSAAAPGQPQLGPEQRRDPRPGRRRDARGRRRRAGRSASPARPSLSRSTSCAPSSGPTG